MSKAEPEHSGTKFIASCTPVQSRVMQFVKINVQKIIRLQRLRAAEGSSQLCRFMGALCRG